MPFVIKDAAGRYFDAKGRGKDQWIDSKSDALQFARAKDGEAFNRYLRGNKVGRKRSRQHVGVVEGRARIVLIEPGTETQ